jgi:hypothetical protein
MTTATATKKPLYYAMTTQNGMGDIRFESRRQAVAQARMFGLSVHAYYADGTKKFL